MKPITKIQQRRKDWCLLACIESASRDRQTQIWTQELLEEKFNRYFPAPDYGMVPLLLPSVCFNVGLGNYFHLGTTKEWLLPFRPDFETDKVVVFVSTESDGKGGVWGHSLRLAAIRDDEFEALNPSTGNIEPFKWDWLETHKCLLYVVGWSDYPVLRDVRPS